MRIAAKSVVALTLILGLAACGSPAEDKAAAGADSVAASPAAAATTAAAAADGRPAAFAQCVACHSTEKGKMGIGPSLAGVYGTKSGEIAGFAFSDAMKNANLTWDDATLDKYLAAPMKMVPGTKMTFAGLTDAAKRKEVIEYIKTLK
ncbi:c-type cytochrome [Novosphingobium sp. B 225]|uniref:c-type cytochrome n=1 Tax=Novosphingobium sp. B 225 TaxID=1961849 RepID=UPI000B4A8D4B|nr:c-type cytochrome [Novosphingobium sp. B 225]